MPTPKQLPDGRWRVRVKRGTVQISRTFARAENARKWAEKTYDDLGTGKDPRKEQAKAKQAAFKLWDALERYRPVITARNPRSGDRELTIVDTLQRHPITQKPFAAVTRQDVLALLEEFKTQGPPPPPQKQLANGKLAKQRKRRPCSPQRLHHYRALIRRLYNVAHDQWGFEGLNNPAARIGTDICPPSKMRDRRLQPGEQERLLAHLPATIRVMFLLSIETTLRQSNVLELTWGQVELSARELIIPADQTKNHQPLRVPLTRAAVAAFKDIRPRRPKRDDHVFPSITRYELHSAFDAARRKAGITDLRWHDSTRAEGISRLFETGLNIPEVAQFSGHLDWGQLKRYARMVTKHTLDKLDRLQDAKAKDAGAPDPPANS